MKKLMIMVAALSMVATFVLTASAAEWNFYGSARVSTFWNTVDVNTAGVDDVDAFGMGLQGNSRIGANVKVSDELTGRFEVGNSSSTWNTRIIWGEWNFGAGSFGVGQHYTPLNMFYSNQVYGGDTDLLPYGGVYSGRQAMLQLKFGGFKVALTPANTDTNTDLVGAELGTAGQPADPGVSNAVPGVPLFTAASTEVSFPAIEMSYHLKFDTASLSLKGGYQTFKETVGTHEEDIDSYVVALGGSVNFGPGYVKGNVYTGQNASNLIWLDAAGESALAVNDGARVFDVDTLGFLIVIGAKVNDMFAVEAGYAKASSELDGAAGDADTTSYYAQATVTLAPGVFFVPEVGVIDQEWDEMGIDTQNTYFGAKWQINF